MEEHMKTKKIFILPTILILILCISTVPVRAATLGKVTGIKVKQLSEEKAKLTWSPKTWAKGYEVYQKSGSGKYKKIKSTGKTTLTINNLNAGQTYYFRVRAFKKSSGKKVYGKYSSSVKIIMKKNTEAETKIFTVSPKSNPYQNKYVGSYGFTEQTRSYYVLRSYLEYFANIGGGELHLQKGTYNLLYCLYIPSNTTIVFEDGVTIRRMDKSTLFTLCSYNDLHTGKKFYGYSGVHDVKLIGKGNVVFDKEYGGNAAILMGHTKNILIEGITFAHMSDTSSHFIEMDASYNVEIRNCIFRDSSSSGKKEAINLDVPDAATGGFTWEGSSMDKTADNTIYIHNNVFKNLTAGIGTHMYTPGHPHKNIRIENNSFSACRTFAIRAQNWENSYILNNTFSNISAPDDSALSIDARGISNVIVKNNTATNSDTFMKIIVSRYSDSTIASRPGLTDYEPIYNSVNKEDVIYNTVSGLKTNYAVSYVNSTTHQGSTTQYWNAQS